MKTITQKEVLDLYNAARANTKAISEKDMRRTINGGTLLNAKCFSVQIERYEYQKDKMNRKIVK